MRKKILLLPLAWIMAAVITTFLRAQPQNTPVVNQGTAGDRVVSGWAAPDAGELKVYDLSIPSRPPIQEGKTSMDSNGNFAVSVKPPLVQGHQIVVEDSRGRSSPPMTVKEVDPIAGRP